MQFWFSKIEKVGFIKFDISPIKIVAFWKKKLFEMPCQFSFIFQYIVNSKPTIFNFPFWPKYDQKKQDGTNIKFKNKILKFCTCRIFPVQ